MSSLIKCAPDVRAKCPFKVPCCGDEEASYLDGSDCDKFAKKVLAAPQTNGDWMRSADDKDLAFFLCNLLDAGGCITKCPAKEHCHAGHNGMIDWLKQPHESEG